MNKKIKVVLIVLSISIIILLLGSFFFYQKEKNEQIKLEKEKHLVKEIKSHYNQYVKTIKKTKLYIKDNKKYKEIGSLAKDEIITLKKQNINKNTKYFQIDNINYYIKYQNVEKVENKKNIDNRYKNYIPFNENILTKDITNLYQNEKLVYTLNKKLDLPIIRKEDGSNYVEYNNELFLIKQEDIESIYQKENTNLPIASSIAATAYHFIYLNGDNSCNELICHSEEQIKSHFNYLKENNYFTLTTKEMEWFIDGKIRLPEKSILVTIDDGSRAEKFIPILEEYKINATLFLITGWYSKENYLSNYLEVASHSNDLHNPGKCPGGQGGPIKCLDKETLLNDLKTSREKLDGTEAFCFPFYEYNDYAIEILKEAGFKTAYIGGMKKVTPGINKYKIPRITLNRNTTIEEYADYIK